MTNVPHQDTNQFLKQRFMQEVRVLDEKTGYLTAPAFNLRIDPQILSAAAQEIAGHFADEKISVIHGIPHSGVYLATAVSLALHKELRLHTSRKDQVVPASWKEVFRKEVRSFTTNNQGSDIFSGINLSFVSKGDRVLLVDDVCAYGETGAALINGLLEKGVVVAGFAVLFDKVFQGGLERISELGVKTFSCVRVKKILKTGGVSLV